MGAEKHKEMKKQKKYWRAEWVKRGALMLLMLTVCFLTYGSNNTNVKKISTINNFSLTFVGQAFHNPEGLFYDKNRGQLYVADTGSNKIFIYNDEKPFLEIQENIMFPKSLAVSSKGKLFVLEKEGKVKIFNAKRAYTGILKFPEEDVFPVSVTVDRKDNVVVLEKNKCKVFVFDKKDALVSQFGECGDKDGQFLSPEDIAVDAQGNILVADSKRLPCALQVFTSDGKFKYGFGKIGLHETEFTQPAAVSVDRYGKIFVADSSQHRIKVFLPGGSFLFQFGAGTDSDISFFAPVDIALNDTGRMYVLEKGANQFQILQVNGQ